MKRSPLHSVHTRSGAELREYRGWELPGSFGDPPAEYRALRRGGAIVDRSHTGRIEQRGADALDLLHRLTTNSLLDLSEGECRSTVLTSDRGRVVGVLTVVRRPGRPLLLLTGEGSAADAVAGIDRYTIIEDSELCDVSDATAQIAVAGPSAPAAVARALGSDAASLETRRFTAARANGAAVDVIRTDEPIVPTFEVVSQADDAASVWAALAAAGATPVGLDAYESVRVEQGMPAPGRDADERTNPLEANLEHLVDFDKGCYVGQEVIARLDTYDRLQRRLVGLLASSPLIAGQPLIADSRTVGRVTSVAGSPVLGRPVGLGYVRKNLAAPGTRLSAASAGEVEVASLPLADGRADA